MATLRKVKQEDGKYNYILDFRQNGVRRRWSLKTDDRALAEQIRDDMMGRIARKEFDIHDYEKKNVTLRQFCSEYIEGYSEIQKSKGSVRIDEQALRDFVEYFGDSKTPRDVTKFDAEDFRMYLLKRNSPRSTINKKRLSPTTVNIKMRALRTAFNWALREPRCYVDENPFSGLKQLPMNEKKPRFIPIEDLPKLFETMRAWKSPKTPQFVRYVELLLLTGARKMEVLSLTWADVDTQNQLISFNKTKTRDFRVIPIEGDVEGIVTWLREQSPDLSPTAPVFDQLVVHSDYVSQHFKKMVKKAGLPSDIHLHCLRHTNAFLHRMKNTPIADIKDLLGHHDLATTMRYAKVDADYLRPLIGKLRLNEIVPEKQDRKAS